MTDGSRWHRVQEVFDSVVERPQAERAALLAEACGDDAELRAEVESLLACNEQTPADFMRPPEPPPGIRPPDVPDGPDPLIGQSVGSYRIKSVIAAGGMGTVYEAEQEQPQRIVALKVMNRYVASRSALRRFQSESQILAYLRHPNIAQVYEAGLEKGTGSEPEAADVEKQSSQRGACPLYQPQPTATGVPYFAMEYVPDAKTITQFAEESRLDTRDRLRLFAKVCDAVHHGHQKGIIHRDLKPANILVDSAGEPKVIDFGVARATDSDIAVTTLRTDVGQLIGTLQYMSPEQCDADPHEIDTRSDVYSLGVVLYELLTGELPYEATGSTIVQAARVICERTPIRPSTIDRKLRGDVEMIALKALQKEREKRYQSAAELARDVRRYLNREPVDARPPTSWTRLAHRIARRPVLATTAACVAIAVLILSSVFATAWVMSRRPYEIVAVQDPGFEWRTDLREARLVTRSGRILTKWGGKSGVTLGVAKLVERPGHLGGGRVIVLGGGDTADPPLRRKLCFFNADGDLENPIWEKRITTAEILAELRAKWGYTGDDFTFRHGWVLDVFPNEPGDEVVATFGHQSLSQSVIRIYDLAGTLLYQVWYDGIVGHCRCLDEAGLLVFAGDWHGDCWDDTGRLKGERLRDFVVFALRPEVEAIHDAWLEPAADPHSDDPLTPALFLLLRPAGIEERVTRYGLHPARRAPEGRGVMAGVHFDAGDSLGFGWEIDEFGEAVPELWVPSDGHQRNQQLPLDHPNRLPDPNDVKLVPYEQVVQH